MSTELPPKKMDWRWMALIGALVAALVIGSLIWWNRSVPAAQSTPSAPAATSGTPTADPSATASAAATEQSATESASPSVSGTKQETPYCVAFRAITTAGVSTSNDEGGVDLGALSKKFTQLIKKYSAAAVLAPADLKDDYATVLKYLKQSKKAVDSRDLEQIKSMVRNLSSLNDTMTSIQTQSEQLCG